MPKISIIVPIYNVEKYIHKCLDSLIHQTFKDIEIICVDDCGQDNSIEIVNQFAKKDSRIKILYNSQNRGLSESRNNGIKNSSGEYIMFCDSDDWFNHNMCETMLKAITKNKSDLVVCGTNVIYESDVSCRNSDQRYFKISDTQTLNMTEDILKNCNVCAWNKIYKSEIIKKHNVYFPKNLKYEDNFYFPAYCLWVNKISFIKDNLYNYRRREGSIMNQTFNSKKINLDPLKIAIAYFEYAKNNNKISTQINWFWGDMFYNLFSNVLDYSNPKMHNACYENAKNFITENFLSDSADFYTKRKIEKILSKTVYPYKLFFKTITIKDDFLKKDTLFLGLSIFKKKFYPNKIKYYLFGLKIFERKKFIEFSVEKNLKNINIDNSNLIKELKKLGKFTYIPNPGNAGDMLIASATYAFFRKNKIKYKRYYKNKKTLNFIVYGGGGIWTKDYEKDWMKFLPIFSKAKKIVILPSSFNNCQKLIDVLDERFVVFCREEKSYKYMCEAKTKAKILLDNDMVFRMSEFPQNIYVSDSNLDILYKAQTQTIPKKAYFLRKDKESVINYKTDLDVSALAEGFTDTTPQWADFCSAIMLSVINKADIVITDRLHVAIGAFLLNKEVYMIDNSYGKLSAVYRHSMSHYKNVHFCNSTSNI